LRFVQRCGSNKKPTFPTLLSNNAVVAFSKHDGWDLQDSNTPYLSRAAARKMSLHWDPRKVDGGGLMQFGLRDERVWLKLIGL
jgi:hypothetical protein